MRNTKIFALLLMVCCACLGVQARIVTYRSMAMYIGAESVDALTSPQEKAAAQLFQQRFADYGTIITPSQVNKIKYPDFDCLWVNIDQMDKPQGLNHSADAYNNAEFIAAVKAFYQAGGNLYLSKFAIELLYSDGIGAVADYMRPNVFSSGAGGNNADIWSINPEIGAVMKDDADRSRYIDHRSHPVFANLATLPSNGWAASKDPIYDQHVYQVYPMQGRSNFEAIHREDHNCMWRVAFKEAENAKVGVYCGYEGVHSFEEIDKVDNAQERAVLDFLLNPAGDFRSTFPNVRVEVVCPGDIERIDPNNFDCLWIHIDRCGIEPGWQNLPEAFKRADLIDALREYTHDGGNLLLTKHATQLVSAIGRIDAAYAPGIFGSGDGGNGTDIWTIQARIGLDNITADPSQYYDRSSHAIYANLQTVEAHHPRANFDTETFPMEGTADGAEMWREDHNCMWDLNAYQYSADGRNTVERFEAQNKAQVLGTWGHVKDYAVAGIVEFLPTAQYRGRIIANGMAACEWAPRSGVNAYAGNLRKLSLNSLQYLVRVTDFHFVSEGPDGVARFEQDANATVLGTWGQDWNHQAAGLVEFHPRGAAAVAAAANPSTPEEVAELNKDKAPAGTIIANGLGCVQLHHADGNNDYSDNVDRLTANIIDYLSPWHYRIASGVEDVAVESEGRVFARDGRICWNGFDATVVLEVYTLDGRTVLSMPVQGEGAADCPVSGVVVVNAAGKIAKLIL